MNALLAAAFALGRLPSRARTEALRRLPECVNPAVSIEITTAREQVCHYVVQPLVELYGGCMVALKVS